MKLFGLIALTTAQKNKLPDMSKIAMAQNEINMGARNDGSAVLIQQIIEFYLAADGIDISFAPQLLSYGCWCQLLGDQRKHGLGEPLDTLDQICKGIFGVTSTLKSQKFEL